jgi:hypothetical protein
MGLQQLQQQNVSAPAIYTQYSIAIPRGVNQVTLSVRPGGTPANVFWYMATTNGSTPGSSSNLPQSPNTYNTIPANSSRTIAGQLGGQIIYFQVDQTNQVLEVDYYGDN